MTRRLWSSSNTSPTGIATAVTLAAFPLALASDSVSAFGGIIACNRVVEEALVDAIGSLFVEAIVAPDFSPPAQQMLGTSRKNCRLLHVPLGSPPADFEVRSVREGYLIQQPDLGDPPDADWRVVSQRRPTSEELQAMQFGWKAVQNVKSNAIVLAVQNATVGIGGGLPSRVDAVRLAVEKAGERAQGAILASDAFFPFPDSVAIAAEAGVSGIVQPGGSIRDQDVIDAVDAHGLAMVFTGVRHRH